MLRAVGQGDTIRTCGLRVPNAALSQPSSTLLSCPSPELNRILPVFSGTLSPHKLPGRIARDGARASSSSIRFSENRRSDRRLWDARDLNPARRLKRPMRRHLRLHPVSCLRLDSNQRFSA